MLRTPIFIIAVAVLLLNSACREIKEDPRLCTVEMPAEKIRGANCSEIQPLAQWYPLTMRAEWNAEWASLVPVAMATQGSPYLGQTGWTQTLDIVIQRMRANGYKVMLKPHVDVNNATIHRGEFTLSNANEWDVFQGNYRTWLLEMARIARDYDLEMFCMGTELRTFVEQRPKFWQDLIEEIRTIYSGPLTYAANWDEYGAMPFWDQLDYIGIDGYFPLVEAETPEVEDLVAAWKPDHDHLYNMYMHYCKPVLFTEVGYRSVNFAGWEHWNISNNILNYDAQSNGFEAFFQAFWDEDWVAGAFIWDWRTWRIDPNNTEWTPQDKPAAEVIKSWFAP